MGAGGWSSHGHGHPPPCGGGGGAVGTTELGLAWIGLDLFGFTIVVWICFDFLVLAWICLDLYLGWICFVAYAAAAPVVSLMTVVAIRFLDDGLAPGAAFQWTLSERSYWVWLAHSLSNVSPFVTFVWWLL